MALLLGNILIFAAYQYIQQMSRRYMDLRLQQQKEQADRSYYKTLQEQYDNQRIMIHDIRHHLGLIKELAKAQNEKVSCRLCNGNGTSASVAAADPILQRANTECVAYSIP